MKFEKYLYILLTLLLLFALYLISLYSFLLFHSLVEIFSIVVAFGIFIIAWNSRALLDNHYLLFIGIAYLFVGAIDLIHTLAYPGMNIFIGYKTNLATQLWIGARYLESLSLLIAPFFIKRRVRTNLEFLGYMIIISLLLMSVFYWKFFPVCFIEGVGLTPFKKISEYLISLILLGSLIILGRKRDVFDTRVFRLLVLSILFTIASELSFTFYINAYGFSNLIGHFFKVISFYLIYKALVETGLTKPYNLLFRNLKKSEEELRKAHDELEMGVQERTEKLAKVNRALWTLSECNQVIGRAKEESELLQEMCRTIVEVGGYHLAWIGFIENDKEKTIQPVAKAGFKEEYGDLTWVYNKKDHDPIGLAIQTRNPVIAKNILNNPAFSNLRKEAIKWGYTSSVALPLMTEGQFIGMLSIYAKGPDAFDTEEMKLLEELSNDMTYGIIALRTLTERKQVEEALRKSEARLELQFDRMPIGCITWNPEFRVLSWNPAAEKIFGFTVNEAMGKHPYELIVPKDVQPHVDAVWSRLLEGDTTAQSVNENLTKDGRTIICHWTNTPLKESDDRVVGVLSMVQDVTERKRAEETLQESEETARALVNATTDSVFLIDTTGMILSLSEITAKRLGNSVKEMLGSYLFDFLPLDVAQRRKIQLDKVLRTGKPVYFEDERQGMWFDTCGYPIFDATGKITKIAIYAREITERKRAEVAVDRLSQENAIIAEIGRIISSTLNVEEVYERFGEEVRKVIHFDRIAITIINQEKGTFYNAYILGDDAPDRRPRNVISLVGSFTEKVMRSRSSQLVQSDDRNEVIARFPALLPHFQSGIRSFMAVPLISKDQVIGVLHIFSANSKAYTEADKNLAERVGNQIAGAIANAKLFAGYKQMQEALKGSEERFKDLYHNAPVGYHEFSFSTGGCITQVNQTELEMLGYTEEEILGRYPWDFIVEQVSLELVKARLESDFLLGRTIERTFRRKDGTTFPGLIHERFLRDEGGQIIGIRAAIQDITERKQAEDQMNNFKEQLRQSQKMEAIGRLAGGIAHDFNNLLTIIKGYSQLSLLKLKENGPLREATEEIKKAADQATDLIRQILAFSRRQILEMKILDLNTVLKNLDKMLHRVLGEDIELVTFLADDLGRVKTDPGWIEQIIMNLVVNSRDAMPSGGRLTIETTNVELDESYASRHVAVMPGHYVMLSVSDTGIGMTPEVKERVFEPFFTTKESGKGTGLGLSIVYGIVKQSGGDIRVYSEPGQGTVFKIYLPRVEEPSEELREKEMEGGLPRGNETILVVEDHDDVRKLASQILEGQGYRILQASCGHDGLVISKEWKGPIHMILTDVVMPRMSGREFAERCKESRQNFKVLYMSGYTDNAIVHHGVLEQGTNLIQKPFTVEGLARKVREVLDKA